MNYHLFLPAFWFTTFLISGQNNSVQTREDCTEENRMQLFCFFGLWYAQESFNSVSEDNLDDYLCNHLILAYGNTDYRVEMNKWAFQLDEDLVRKITRRKNRRSGTQYLISLGGWGDFEFGSEKDRPRKYRRLAREPEARASFHKALLNLLNRLELDGMDFFWNWIGRYKGDAEDMADLRAIASHVCDFLRKTGFICSITLRLTLADDDGYKNESIYADVLETVRSADVVHIWTIDLAQGITHFLIDDLLLPDPANTSHPHYKTSINYVVDYYKEALREEPWLFRKLSLVMGLQWNAQGVTKVPEELGALNAPPGSHPLRNQNDIRWQYPYYQLCNRLQGNVKGQELDLVRVEDTFPVAYSPNFAASGTGLAVSILDRKEVQRKVRFARAQGFGAVSLFQIGADDVHGWCYNRSYPILEAINEALEECRLY